jgi:hypothetical protein
MATAFRLREGTSSQYEMAKILGTLQPKSLYLIDGKPRLTLTGSTEFVFADLAAVSQMIAGISSGDGSGEGSVRLGTLSGQAPTAGGTPGTSLLAAHEDHTHPVQTSVSGNAATATSAQSAARLATLRTFRLTGAVTGHAQFSGEADCVIATTLSAAVSGHSTWLGTAAELPAVMDANTIYFVYE